MQGMVEAEEGKPESILDDDDILSNTTKTIKNPKKKHKRREPIDAKKKQISFLKTVASNVTVRNNL
jgi:hypothetical protein